MDIQEFLPDAPHISKETISDMSRKYLSHYLFYSKHKTYIGCFCTSCCERYRLERNYDDFLPYDEKMVYLSKNISHNSPTKCIKCGADVTCKSEGMSRDKLNEVKMISCFVKKDDKVYVFCGRLSNHIPLIVSIKDFEKMCIPQWIEDYAIEYAPQSARLFNKVYGVWDETEFSNEPYYRIGLYQYKHYDIFHNAEVLQESFLKYFLPDKINNEIISKDYSVKPLYYLSFAAKYPAFEMLIRLGAKYIIDDIIIHNREHKSVLDLSGKSCAEVFRTDSNDAALIRQAIQKGERINIDVLQCYRKLRSIARKQGRKYKLEDAVILGQEFNAADLACRLIKKTYLTPQKLVNYIDKQLRKRKRYDWYSRKNTLRDYRDYIEECQELGYDVTDEQICKPKDMYAAHERTSAAVAVIEKERAEKEDRERTTVYLNGIYKEDVDKYEYYGEEYSIIVPKSAFEIIEEGKNQHHCVAGYANRHMEGKLAILFMRDSANIETALYTIEMNGNSLVQIRGKNNCDPTQEAKKFIDKWLKWVRLPENTESNLKGA